MTQPRRLVGLALVLGLAWAGSATIAGRHPSALEILRRAEQIRSPDFSYAADFNLQVLDPNSSWKERTAFYSLVAGGKENTLVLMREPRQFYPGLLLIEEGRYWLLLPRSNRAFQLAPRHVLNGDISNGDLARGNLLAYYEPTFGGEAEIKGHSCWWVELNRTSNLGMHKRIVGWIEKRTFRPIRFEYFGETGKKLKVAVYEDYQESPIGVRAMRIIVDSRVRPGERTTMTFSNLRRFDSDGIDFSRDAMPAHRDKIRSAQPEPGAGTPLEKLLR